MTVGFKSSLEWQDNWFSDNALQAKVEMAATSEKRRVAYTLSIMDGGNKEMFLLTCKAEKLELDKESGRYLVEALKTLELAKWREARSATFSYNVYEEFERVSLGRDTLRVIKP